MTFDTKTQHGHETVSIIVVRTHGRSERVSDGPHARQCPLSSVRASLRPSPGVMQVRVQTRDSTGVQASEGVSASESLRTYLYRTGLLESDYSGGRWRDYTRAMALLQWKVARKGGNSR